MSSSTQDLAGRHAVVTGASRGIGLACARELARLGANVTLLARDAAAVAATADKVAAEFGVRASGLAADMTDFAAVEGAFAQAAQALGRPSILVNNAGASAAMPFHKMTAAHWREMMAINLDGVFNACRAAIPAMLEEKWGRIVTIASITGLKGSGYIAAYSSSKHGAVGLTRCLAVEYGARNITANAICPGYVATDMTERTIANIVEKTGRTREQAIEGILKAERQVRMVQPEEVAAITGHLCLPSSGAITGQAIVLSGGET